MIPETIVFIVAIILVLISVFYLIFIGVTIDFDNSTLKAATVYGFEMTEDLIEEERMLTLCIEWKIENNACGQIYGGIDGSNGEPESIK